MDGEVSQSDLDRLGITRAQWDASRARMATEPLIEVRVATQALGEALEAAGIDYTISTRPPQGWWTP